MSKLSINQNFFKNKKESRNNPNQKIFLTLFLIFLFRFGNAIPLSGIDQEALKKSFLQLETRNSIMQIINMYSAGGTTNLSSFSLGIIPFINASIFFDLLIPLFPTLEKLQSEEGEAGRQKILLYKKILTFGFSIVQSFFLLSYLKPYLYSTENIDFLFLILELVTGSMLIVWITSLIDNKGIGNGTSLIIFVNIISSLINKIFFNSQKFDFIFFLQIIVLIFLTILICISQTARIKIDLVSARQLSFLKANEKLNQPLTSNFQFKTKVSGLSLRLNQAGIFPIIIASNLIPFISSFFQSNDQKIKIIINLLYYFLIIATNYFYTILTWDPEKISEQLRKSSVSIVNVRPGKETINYLENIARSTSLVGGFSLCVILFLYDFFKQIINGYLLNQLNVSSLIILIGVSFEIQKIIRVLYKNIIEIPN